MADTAATTPEIKHPGYQNIDYKEPLDSEVSRNWLARWLVLAATAVGTLFVLTSFGRLVAGGFGEFVGLILACALYVPLTLYSFIDVSDWHGFGTIDRLNGGNIVSYGPGLHVSFWWERRLKRNNASLKATTRTFTVTVPTQDTAVLAEMSYQFAGDITCLPNFLGIRTLQTVDEGYKGFLESFVFSELQKKSSDGAMASVNDINRDLEATFQGKPGDIIQLEQKFGLKTVSVVLKGVTLPEAVQKTRDSGDETTRIFKNMANLRGTTPEKLAKQIEDGTLSSEDESQLRILAMAASEQSGVNVQSIQGLAGLFGGRSSGKKK